VNAIKSHGKLIIDPINGIGINNNAKSAAATFSEGVTIKTKDVVLLITSPLRSSREKS
jgi:hypothetical protein